MNTTYNSEIIPDAYERWSSYRKLNTDFIIDSDSYHKGIIILGAGRCNDIDLLSLSRYYRDIMLVDRDMLAMQEAITAYDLHGNEHIHLVQQNFTKVDDECIDEFHNMLYKKKDYSAVLEYLDNIIVKNTNLSTYEFLENVSEDVYDTVVCIGVHSQLVVRLISTLEKYRHHFNAEQLEEVKHRLSDLIDITSRNLNYGIFNIPGIKYTYIGYEYAAFYKDDEKLVEDNSLCKLQPEDIKYLYEHGMSHKVAEYNLPRVEGAYECELDLTKRLHSNTLEIQGFLYNIWPLTREKEYLTIIYMFEK